MLLVVVVLVVVEGGEDIRLLVVVVVGGGGVVSLCSEADRSMDETGSCIVFRFRGAEEETSGGRVSGVRTSTLNGLVLLLLE